MHWTGRLWKYAALLGSSVILLQTTTGCPVDDATLNSIVTTVGAQLVQAVLSGQFCPTTA
jgi:hypothetical protein